MIRPTECHVCGRADLHCHCASAGCSWSVCQDCGAISALIALPPGDPRGYRRAARGGQERLA